MPSLRQRQREVAHAVNKSSQSTTQAAGSSFSEALLGRALLGSAVVAFLVFQLLWSQGYLSKQRAEDIPALRRLNFSTQFVFLHIPKTAGTTVAGFIKGTFSRNCSTVKLQEPGALTQPLADADRFFQLLTQYKAHGVEEEDATQRIMRFHNMPCYSVHEQGGEPDSSLMEGRRALMDAVVHHGARFRHIMGHMPFGYCAFAEKGCMYVTVLREPMARMYSHYHDLKHTNPGMLAQQCQGKCEDFPAFVDLVASGRLAGLLLQTRMLAGDAFWATALPSSLACTNGLALCDNLRPQEVTRKTLETAKFNIRNHFAVVGTMEHLTLFKHLMEAVFDLPPTNGSWAVAGLNSTMIKVDDFRLKDQPARTQQQLIDMHRYDTELYDYVLKVVFSQYARLKALPPRARQPTPELVHSEVDDKVGYAVMDYFASKAKAQQPDVKPTASTSQQTASTRAAAGGSAPATHALAAIQWGEAQVEQAAAGAKGPSNSPTRKRRRHRKHRADDSNQYSEQQQASDPLDADSDEELRAFEASIHSVGRVRQQRGSAGFLRSRHC